MNNATGRESAVLISLREIHLGLEQTLHAYLNKTSWRAPVTLMMVFGKPKFLTTMTADMNLATLVISTLIAELVTEVESDMRNAGQLRLTENVLIQHFVDERTAHEIAENLFSNVVNTLGEHLPDLTFSNHKDFRYEMAGDDLLVWRSGLQPAELQRTYFA
jgi:hypothetical protein